MSFVGCSDFKLSGGVYNYVKGNHNHTVNRITNNDSNNNYSTTNYGDRCVTNNGGRVSMNQDEEQRPRGKNKKKHRPPGVGYGYRQEPFPQISPNQNFEQRPQQPLLNPPQPQFSQWNQPHLPMAGNAGEPSNSLPHPPLHSGNWQHPPIHANPPYHHPNPSNHSYSPSVNPPVPTASAPPNPYPYGSAPAPTYDSNRPYPPTYLYPPNQNGVVSPTQAHIHHSLHNEGWGGPHDSNQNGNGNWHNPYQDHPGSVGPSLMPMGDVPYHRPARSAPPDHGQVHVQGPPGLGSAGDGLNGDGFLRPESQNGAFAWKKVDPRSNPNNPFSMASANANGRGASRSSGEELWEEEGEEEEEEEEEENLKAKAKERGRD